MDDAMNVINLTPHQLRIFGTHDRQVILPPYKGKPARVDSYDLWGGFVKIAGIQVDINEHTLGEVVDLPEPQDGVWYVVSLIVKQACPERNDLLSPGPILRDEKGRPYGCKGLRK